MSPKSVADCPKVGHRFPDKVQLVVAFLQVGKVRFVASICMEFWETWGLALDIMTTFLPRQRQKTINIGTWRTAEISLFVACSALQQQESRNCSAETLEFVHGRRILLTELRLAYSYWCALMLVTLDCQRSSHHSSQHYLKVFTDMFKHWRLQFLPMLFSIVSFGLLPAKYVNLTTLQVNPAAKTHESSIVGTVNLWKTQDDLKLAKHLVHRASWRADVGGWCFWRSWPMWA